MIYIKKKRTPDYLTQELLKNRGVMSEPAIYGSLDSKIKKRLYGDILQEQHYLCAYCMSRIDFYEKTIPDQAITIDHFLSQTKHPEKAMSYNNMLGSCTRCQNNKGSEDITINPLEEGSVSTLRYRRSGEIESSDESIQKDLALMKLNSEKIIEARKASLSAFEKKLDRKYKNKKITTNEWNNIKRAFLGKEEYTPFIGIVLWFIERHIRQAG